MNATASLKHNTGGFTLLELGVVVVLTGVVILTLWMTAEPETEEVGGDSLNSVETALRSHEGFHTEWASMEAMLETEERR